MKKIGKKLSFLTKIFLVVGLLISNLSSLSIVFAYEVSDDLVIALNGNSLEISYTEQVEEDVENVDVKVYEKYSYSDTLSEDEVITTISLNEEQVLALKEGTLELTHSSIFDNGEDVVENYEIFDGTYSVRVDIIDLTVYEEEVPEEETVLVDETVEEEISVIASNTYEQEMKHESGLSIKLFDAITDEEITLVNGKYPVSKDASKVKVVAQILPGGLNPEDTFKIGAEDLKATELIKKLFTKEVDFNGHLFGDHEIALEINILKELPTLEVDGEEVVLDEVNTHEEVIYTENIKVMYESYLSNAEVLNSEVVTLGYDDAYLFYGDSKDGKLYLLSQFDEEVVSEESASRTMLDLYKVLVASVGEVTSESSITYTLVKDGVNVLEGYDEATGISLEEYLKSITLDETVVVTLTCGDLEITYSVVATADFNGDSVVNEEDLEELINQVVGSSEITDISKSDIYKVDGKVDTLDVIYLDKVIENKNWETDIQSYQATLNSKLNVLFNEEALSEDNYLVSGDKFTVDYILSLSDYEVNGIAGLFDYDKSVFELLSLNINYDWLGNNHDGKFLYFGEEVLTMPEVTEDTEEIPSEDVELTVVEEDDESLEEVVLTNDYVVVSLTFKTLKATDGSVITLKDIELFNTTGENSVYYELDNNTVSTETIQVKASDDNTLSYLSVAGVDIELIAGVYEYEITVDNDVTDVDLKYILNNEAASVTSSVFPEELVEGSNTIVVTVVSESGISQDYTVTVVREKAPEPTTQVNNSYYNNYEEDIPEEIIVTPGTEEEETPEDKEEKDSYLSRIVIIILIVIVIAGLVYLIFKDEDSEEKKANKDINRLKKEPIVPEEKEVSKTTSNAKVAPKKTNKPNSGKKSSKK